MGNTCSSPASPPHDTCARAIGASRSSGTNPLAAPSPTQTTRATPLAPTPNCDIPRVHLDPALESPVAPTDEAPPTPERAATPNTRKRPAHRHHRHATVSEGAGPNAAGFATAEPSLAEHADRLARVAGMAYVHGLTADPAQFAPEPVPQAVIEAAAARCAEWLTGEERPVYKAPS